MVCEVNKSFGDKHLFSGLTLHVRAGDRIALIGETGDETPYERLTLCTFTLK